MQPVRFGGAFALRAPEETLTTVEDKAGLCAQPRNGPPAYLCVPGRDETYVMIVQEGKLSEATEAALRKHAPADAWLPLTNVPTIDDGLFAGLQQEFPPEPTPRPDVVQRVRDALAALTAPHRGKFAGKAHAISDPAVFRSHRPAQSASRWPGVNA